MKNEPIYRSRIPSVVFLGIIIALFATSFKPGTSGEGILKINFINTANGKHIVIRDSTYTTPWGEQYVVSKLKYYISNIHLAGNNELSDEENYHLIDELRKTSFEISAKEGRYDKIRFMLGVDSLRNCSGTQEGALDPMNDMFWTWNTGYVMFKLEGSSPASASVNGRIEHHVGGYRFGNNVATEVELGFDDIRIKENEMTELNIEMNLDKYWSSANHIKISEDPVCTLPGSLAKKIAANFPDMFSVIKKK